MVQNSSPRIKEDRHVVTLDDGHVRIPDGATVLQQRLCVVAHSGASGHSGAKDTAASLLLRDPSS